MMGSVSRTQVPSARPGWLSIVQTIDGPVLNGAAEALATSPLMSIDMDIGMIPRAALFHLRGCVETGLWANGQGYHAAALGIFRHSVEALSLIDVGLQPPTFSCEILTRWKAGKKSLGEIRKDLEAKIWPGYGTGLWTEPWADYFSNLARSVQPFAHYTPDLMNWQFFLPQQQPAVGSSGELLMLTRLDEKANDPVKAARLYLLSAMVVWTLGRLLRANRADWKEPDGGIDRLGTAIASSKLLDKGQNWSEQLMGHVFFKPDFSWTDPPEQ